MTAARRFLLLHGLWGSGPQHWQTWLAGRLRDGGEDVAYPELPDPDEPRVDAWLDALDRELEAAAGSDLVVLAHSCGALLWLHHSARAGPAVRAERALLVAPPGPGWRHEAAHGFAPPPLDPDGVARASRSTRLVVGEADPYGTEADAWAYALALAVPLDVVAGGAHLNTDAGYGPWPAVEAWARSGAAPLGPNR